MSADMHSHTYESHFSNICSGLRVIYIYAREPEICTKIILALKVFLTHIYLPLTHIYLPQSAHKRSYLCLKYICTRIIFAFKLYMKAHI